MGSVRDQWLSYDSLDLDGDGISFCRFPCRCAAIALCPLGWVVAPWLEASLGSSMSVFLLSSDHCGLMLYESLSCAAPMDIYNPPLAAKHHDVACLILWVLSEISGCPMTVWISIVMAFVVAGSAEAVLPLPFALWARSWRLGLRPLWARPYPFSRITVD
mmetsp:Transcript_115446/g.367138  ORF Transcript_115446/g.367138 Transcript_115446/m.367138 type:complete len:160 (+) Transcript_115446:110-589(+)